jgi:hypothetical protein
MEVITKICGECGEENNIVRKEPKQNNPKAILFICRFCNTRNLRDGTVTYLVKPKALPNSGAQGLPEKIKNKEDNEPENNDVLLEVALGILGVVGILFGIKAFNKRRQGTDKA